jgi:signal transduction histidine kinase
MLALINTGILAYNTATEEVQWMNEALKKIIQIPYIKNLKGISKRDPILYDNITTLLPSESKLIETQQQNTKTKIFITATTFKTADSTQKLLVFQNINHVVEETEAKAWNSLLNVMTHEIMNSVAPISSLADTLLQNYHEQQTFNNEKDIDVKTGIETIKRRSDGLLRFAQVYRNLNAIQQLKKGPIYVQRILEHFDLLMGPTLNAKNIDWQISVHPIDLIVLGDNDLLEQVFINLITNALEALKCTQEPLLHIKAEQHEDGTTIKVIDNEQGIDEEIKDKIFIPFFTTKKNGNGIGPSLCKQIMLLHKGDIQVHSISGKGSIFTLYFNNVT